MFWSTTPGWETQKHSPFCSAWKAISLMYSTRCWNSDSTKCACNGIRNAVSVSCWPRADIPGSTNGVLKFQASTASRRPGVKVFHAGTEMRNGHLVTAGGRVLGVTAKAATLQPPWTWPMRRQNAFSSATCISAMISDEKGW